MFQYNFLIIYRSFIRSKSTFIINLIGLSTGLACALLIYLWVSDELSVDKFHEKDRHLFQVMEHWIQPDGIVTNESTSGYMAEAFVQEMPEVEYATTVRGPLANVTLTVDDKNIKATGQYVGKDFFNIFSYPIIQGDKSQVWAHRNSMMISEALAMKLFNTSENIMGKPVELQHEQEFFISGVFETVPSSSSAQFDFVLSFEEFAASNEWVLEWNSTPTNAYVVLKSGNDVDTFNEKISDYVKIKTNGGIKHRIPFLKRYSETYLYGKYENGLPAGGRIEYVELFSVIAIFILVIACINFMNLSTAKASRRLKEVGVKKAMGAGRQNLILQYLGESLLMTFASLILALLFVLFLLPQFNEITGKHLTLNFETHMVLTALGITLFTGLIAGSYPAFYLSGFNPVTVLKGRLNTSVGELLTRKGLVVFQFALSIILIVSVVVVYKQIEYAQTKNLGYNKDNIILFDREGKAKGEDQLEPFLSELGNIPGVVNASSIGHDLTGHNWGIYGFEWEGKDPDDNTEFDLEWWFFGSAGLAALFIAWFTVGLQTVKAARINPTECLKEE
jgi:putative ABC transport system permease protein